MVKTKSPGLSYARIRLGPSLLMFDIFASVFRRMGMGVVVTYLAIGELSP